MGQNRDNIMISFSFQQLLSGDDWHLWDNFPTVDATNTNSSDPFVMPFTREERMEQWLQSSTNEQPGTTSQEEDLEEEIFTYEELLYLAEEIGGVYTKIMVDIIDDNISRRKYKNCSDETEKCVICQNKLKYNEEASKLVCGHDFHFECIKKWLMVKNMCPLCKQYVL